MTIVQARFWGCATGQSCLRLEKLPTLWRTTAKHRRCGILFALWRNGRVVEGTCLENKQSESSRGFESYFLRQTLRKGRHGAALAVDAAKGPGTPSCRFRSGSPPRGALALPARQSGAPGPFSLTLACSSAQPRLLRGRPSRRGAVAFGKARPFAALPGEAVPPGGRFASRTMARPSLPCA